jgi:hypothetical protein
VTQKTPESKTNITPARKTEKNPDPTYATMTHRRNMLNDGRNSNEQPASKSKKPHQAGEGTAAPIKGKVVRRADRLLFTPPPLSCYIVKKKFGFEGDGSDLKA